MSRSGKFFILWATIILMVFAVGCKKKVPAPPPPPPPVAQAPAPPPPQCDMPKPTIPSLGTPGEGQGEGIVRRHRTAPSAAGPQRDCPACTAAASVRLGNLHLPSSVMIKIEPRK